MSSLFGIGSNGAASFYKGVATQSLRFDDGSSSYLAFTPSSASSSTDRRKVTHSFWVKRGALGSQQTLYSANKSGGGDYYLFAFINTDALRIILDVDDSGFGYTTDALFRDVSAWYNIVIIIDTTQSTNTDRVKIYVNGNLQTTTTTYSGGHVSQNFSTYVMDGNEDEIGRFAFTDGSYFDGYMSEVITTIGQDNTISQFGELKNGVWIPIVYTGSYGANGFRLQFDQVGVGTASTSTIGADTSGNNNHWTSSGIAASDCAMPDSPENNFVTLDPLSSGAGVFSEGNLKYVSTTDTGNGTFGITSGKAYFEVYIGGDTNIYIGILDISDLNPNRGGGWGGHGAIAYRGNGTQYALPKGGGSAVTSYGASLATGDIVGVAFDVDADTVTFYKNNSSQGNTTNGPSHISSNGVYSFIVYGSGDTYIVNAGQDSSFAGTKTAQGNTDANGNGDFYYAPPSGYLALCSANLPEITIGPNSSTQADDHFNTVIYNGSNSAQTITTGLQPDWIWIKVRSSTGYHNITDTSRGVTRELYTNTTDDEENNGRVASSSTTGFTLADTAYGYTNEAGQTFVSWNWHANGGTTSSNSDGSITSTVQANTIAGFSIVTYTGTGSNATVGHALGVAPKVVLVKNRDTAGNNWFSHWTDLLSADNKVMYLASTDGEATNATGFNSTKPTSSVFSVGTNTATNKLNDAHVAYCLADVDGYSKFGKYSGNGSADGTFVYTGFRPAWIMVKRRDSADNWAIYDSVRDTFNVRDSYLYADAAQAEATYSTAILDFLSNGFKWRGAVNFGNNSSGTYIYMAFAEAPFKYANAR